MKKLQSVIFRIIILKEGAGAAVGVGETHVNYSDCAINPIEKWVETLDQLKAVQAENTKLYERLLQSEKEKNELLKTGR
ncbi:hypothetical protein [Pedobacter sp. NJ-S-72]